MPSLQFALLTLGGAVYSKPTVLTSNIIEIDTVVTES